jgi:type II secretory pathway pseudopilin PulG
MTPVRRALTLMELVVVLVILIAVAGVVLPMLPSFLTKTHDAVTTTNISEVDKAIGGFFAANLAYPDLFDSLVDSSGNMYAGLLFNSKNPVSQASFTVVGNVASNTTAAGQPIFVQALSAGQSQSLYYGGIKNLMLMQTSSVSPPTAFNATFPNPPGAASGASLYLGLPGTAGVSVPIPAPSSSSAGPSVLFADNNYVFQKLNIQPTTDASGNLCNYVVFGLGPYCTLVGAKSFGIIDAPVAFGEHSYEQPIVSYARYLCVFRVYTDGTRCEFVGACHDDATGFGTFDMHVQEYYQTTN